MTFAATKLNEARTAAARPCSHDVCRISPHNSSVIHIAETKSKPWFVDPMGKVYGVLPLLTLDIGRPSEKRKMSVWL